MQARRRLFPRRATFIKSASNHLLLLLLLDESHKRKILRARLRWAKCEPASDASERQIGRRVLRSISRPGDNWTCNRKQAEKHNQVAGSRPLVELGLSRSSRAPDLREKEKEKGELCVCGRPASRGKRAKSCELPFRGHNATAASGGVAPASMAAALCARLIFK